MTLGFAFVADAARHDLVLWCELLLHEFDDLVGRLKRKVFLRLYFPDVSNAFAVVLDLAEDHLPDDDVVDVGAEVHFS